MTIDLTYKKIYIIFMVKIYNGLRSPLKVVLFGKVMDNNDYKVYVMYRICTKSN